MPTVTDISQLDLSGTYSYADYLTWRLDEWVELVKGKIRLMTPAPRRAHQAISVRISSVIEAHLFGRPCEVYSAPFDVRLTTASPNGDTSLETVIQPDISVICDPQKLDEYGCVGAPDWIIEIISPSTAGYDTRTKFDLYEEAGVTEYWIAFPGEKSVTAYVLDNGRYQLRGTYYQPGPMPSHTLPELGLTWERVFTGL
jgi:Uma2 family endonuclease